ncbi:MAG TPA: type I-D CRISPR-associated protein Cas5/Csc1 [Leptolyngbyaceae cyanobacterium]
MSTLPFEKAKLVELWCAEPVFFASRELSDTYYTEGAIGNYALAYAFGWVNSPYRLQGEATGRPTYKEDLEPLANACYVLPASPINGRVRFRFERFNALSDSYWYSMTNNRVATAREDVPTFRITGKKPNSFRASNFPQTGRLRMIERGNRFQTLVFGDRELPAYIRLGKFQSKVKVNVVAELPVTLLPAGKYQSQFYLSVADLPPNIELLSFDLISMPPASLLKNLNFQAEAWGVGEAIVPANLHFCCGSKRNDQ